MMSCTGGAVERSIERGNFCHHIRNAESENLFRQNLKCVFDTRQVEAAVSDEEQAPWPTTCWGFLHARGRSHRQKSCRHA